MDRLKSISKSGWHPNSSSEPSYAGASESKSSSSGVTSRLTKNFKGLDQVAGWVGKGGSGNDDGPTTVRPVSALRDPASFGPPPKRIPNVGISNHREVNGEDEKAKGISPEPYTTGPSDGTSITRSRPPPVPPRLPPRDEMALPAPRDVLDMRTGNINMAAVGRLSKAGISVPGFNMSSNPSATKPPLPDGQRPSANINSPGGLRSTPTEGTTLAEKKAALNTANSFYKNPSSVSFSDASAALKTGRNFQQRHGDQVTLGYKKAQEMGLDKKIQGYGDLYASRNETSSGGMTTMLRNSVPPTLPIKKSSSFDMPTRPSSIQNSSEITSSPLGAGKRKPPPPLPKKKPAPPPPKKQAPTDSYHNPTRSPPIIPRTTRPSPSASSVLRNNGLPTQNFPETPPDLELCLEKEWFSKNPIGLPPTVRNIEEKIYSYTSFWERSPSGRTKHTIILAIRWTLNLSTTKIKVTWDASAPSATAKAEQRHFPPPSSPPPQSEGWGCRIVDWVRARVGQQVGNGECWTLAADCFSSLQSEDDATGAQKIMTAQGTSFGLCIFSHYPSLQSQPSVLPGTVLQPGDILQFRSARWIQRDSSGRVVFEMRAGAPEGTSGCKDHTAVVETVKYDSGGGIKLCVLQQNSNGVKTVGRGEYTLGTSDMVEGGVRVFRAVADEWVRFEADW